jgi:hypothetical protein
MNKFRALRPLVSVVALVLCVSWAGSGMAAGIIPADRLFDWKPGVTVGVPGGIPADRTHLIDVTKAPFNADKTGAADAQPAIMQAVAQAAENDVVYLPAGTYRIDNTIHVGTKSRITLRGDGPDKTFLLPHDKCNGAISIGGGGGDWWYPDRLKFSIAGSPARGATVLTLGDTKALDKCPNGGLGLLCQVSLKNDPKLPVITPGHWEYMRKQECRIVAKTPTTVTISPGLLFDLPEALAPLLRPTVRSAQSVGVEDLTVDGKDAKSQIGLGLTQTFGCWVKNVTVRNITNYHISIADSVQSEIRHCHIATRKGSGTNGAGILVGTCSFCLIEDNLLLEVFPHVEVNCSVGNVVAYNYCDDRSIQGDLLGCSVQSNHGAHCSFNLYEGNFAPRFQSDGYHGSASHDTAFRNWFHGTSEKVRNYFVCVTLNRFTRDYSIVGNVLGRKGYTWLYDNADNGFGYNQHLIYVLGLPNMGNGGFNGKTVQPSKGINWADWDKMLASEPGKGPGPSGFQELDLDVKATTLLKGNYNYKDNGVPASESLGGAKLPKSLYLKEKPAWFGNLAWPPFGPDTDFEKNKIPAQVRFEAMNKTDSMSGK